MSSPIALGYADSVTLAAGQLLRVTGGGFITHGNPTRQSLFRGSSVFGPFDTEQAIYITASQSPVSYGTYSAEGTWLGSFASLAELQGAFPSPAIGDYATLIDGSDVPTIYRFGTSGWVASAGGGGGGGVSSVNGKTGTVVLNKADLSLGNVDNTADSAKPVSTAQAAAIASAAASGPVSSVAGKTGAVTLAVADVSGAAPLASPTFTGSPTVPGYAPLASPALTGTPTVPTAAADTNTTQAASTAYVIGQASSSTPAADGTAAVGTSKRYARADHVHPTDTTRAPLASPTFTGTPAAPTASAGTSTTQLATTAFTGTAITNERTASRTLTNVTLTAPAISAPTITGGGALTSPTFTTSTPGIGWQVDSYLGRTTDGVGLVLGSKSTAYNYSTANINGGGHIVGAWSGAYNNSSGKTLDMAIGAENTLGNQAGTVAEAKSSFNTLNENASGATLTEWVGSQSEPTNNAGTITSAKGFQATLPGTGTNTGTISAWTAFDIPDASSSGVSSRVAFDNRDPGAVVKSKTPFADSSVNIPSAPTNGGTTTVPANYGTVVLNSGATIASHTLVVPSTPPDGQTIVFFSVFEITSLSVTSSGNTMIGMPSTLPANGFFTIKYTSQGPYWIRVG